MFPTSFRPQVVKNETTQDVKGLSRECVTAFVVREEPLWVVVVFSSRFAEENEGPDFAARVNSHEIEPCANRQALVECQPDEHAHFSWARVVPYSGDHLSGSGVLEIEVFDEGRQTGRSGGFASVRVASFGRVAKKGRVT
ncbi:unnamed protein product [Sphagnum troendelagicum]|uniref:Uncharacterized protein n=1 Tax=Sphagnum troendelagicum TaxID=128251 RepID=A0ABP0TYZ4_9BRYO